MSSFGVIIESRSGVNSLKVGWVFGAALGLWHVCWAALVALGWAQALLDFVFWMHFMKPAFVVQAFDPSVALVLVLVTTAIGFVLGVVLGALWNWVHR
jgi:hypothetical protein